MRAVVYKKCDLTEIFHSEENKRPSHGYFDIIGRIDKMTVSPTDLNFRSTTQFPAVILTGCFLFQVIGSRYPCGKQTKHLNIPRKSRAKKNLFSQMTDFNRNYMINNDF